MKLPVQGCWGDCGEEDAQRRGWSRSFDKLFFFVSQNHFQESFQVQLEPFQASKRSVWLSLLRLISVVTPHSRLLLLTSAFPHCIKELWFTRVLACTHAGSQQPSLSWWWETADYSSWLSCTFLSSPLLSSPSPILFCSVLYFHNYVPSPRQIREVPTWTNPLRDCTKASAMVLQRGISEHQWAKRTRCLAQLNCGSWEERRALVFHS